MCIFDCVFVFFKDNAYVCISPKWMQGFMNEILMQTKLYNKIPKFVAHFPFLYNKKKLHTI